MLRGSPASESLCAAATLAILVGDGDEARLHGREGRAVGIGGGDLRPSSGDAESGRFSSGDENQPCSASQTRGSVWRAAAATSCFAARKSGWQLPCPGRVRGVSGVMTHGSVAHGSEGWRGRAAVSTSARA